MTITFSQPIFGLGFDLYHVHARGSNKDKYTITATNNLAKGVYIINITNQNNVVSRKVWIA